MTPTEAQRVAAHDAAHRVVWRWIARQRKQGRFAADQFPVGEVDLLADEVAQALLAFAEGGSDGTPNR